MSVNQSNESAGLGLRHYVDVLRRRKWIVIGAAVIAGGLAYGLSSLQKPVYEARTKIVVGQGGGVFPPSVSNAIQPLTATMGNLVTSNVVAQDVITRLGLTDETPESLLSKVSVVVNPTTAVIAVAVDASTKTRAVAIAREIGDVFSELVKERFGATVTSSPDTTGQPQQLPLTATIFDPAHALPGAVSPRPKRNTVLAAALGLFLGLLGAFLREHFDRKLRTREAVEERFGVPVIGQIPWIRTKGGRVLEESGAIGEAFRALRANLQYLGVARPLRTILVTSASPGQGKTTTTANLAVAISRSGATVVALEADLRRPALANAFGHVHNSAGLTAALVGTSDLEASLEDVTPDGEAGFLSLVPSGPLPPNPSELLASLQMTNLLERLSSLYDYVLIDSPPLLLVADTLELARKVDGVVVVARRNDVTTEEAREVRDLVARLGVNLLGVVLTDVEPVGTYYGQYEAKSPDRAEALPPATPTAPTPPPPPEPALVRDEL